MLRQTVTENGAVRGFPGTDARITVYKGIPFAAPPVGENRWKAPQPAENWEGVRECYEFGPITMQAVPGINPDAFYAKEWHVDPEVPMSEDGLYLNVWTPAKRTDEKLPVMVWFFGGGFREGYAWASALRTVASFWFPWPIASMFSASWPIRSSRPRRPTPPATSACLTSSPA